MKRLVASTVAVVVVALAASGSAEAVSCRTWKCVNGQLNTLKAKVNAQNARIDALNGQITALNGQITAQDTKITAQAQALSALTGCLAEVPMTAYGSDGGSFGYIWRNADSSSFNTTALDLTEPDTTVQGWVLSDKCNTRTSPLAVSSRAVFGQIAPAAPLSQFFPEHRP